MATTNYGFPTIAETDVVDGVGAINGLATAVDTSLKTVEGSIPAAYTLPKASATVLGGVKVGSNLSIDSSGKLSATAQGYTLPTATATVLGGVKIGTGISIADGVISVDTTWLATQINNAIAAKLAKGTTWGELKTNGFAYNK